MTALFKGTPPTFSAVTTGTTSCPNAASTVVGVGTVEVNIGGGYDGVNKFTAPIAGRYAFHFTTTTNANGVFPNCAYIAFKKNGVDGTYRVFQTAAGSGAWNPMSASAILDLVAGDYIQATVLNQSGVSISANTSQFSGHLIQ